MSKKTQKTVVDRLAAALERKGVALKRHEMIEITAEAYGFADSNYLAAAAKRGELDPPAAELISLFKIDDPTRGEIPVSCFYDNIAGKHFALDLESCGSPTDNQKIIMSPYGNMLSYTAGKTSAIATTSAASAPPSAGEFTPLRKEGKRFAVTIEWIGEGQDGEYNASNIYDKRLLRFNVQKRGEDGQWEDLDDASYCTQIPVSATPSENVAALEYLLTRIEREAGQYTKRFFESLSWATRSDVDQFCLLRDAKASDLLDRYRNIHIPMKNADELILSSREMTRINGKDYLTFQAIASYNPKTGSGDIHGKIKSFYSARTNQIERLEAIFDSIDYAESSQIEIALHIPVSKIKSFASATLLEIGLTALFGNPVFDGITASFNPQAWYRDDAIDVDPEGPTDFDVTFDVLQMGASARDLADNYTTSDSLQQAIGAPDWIYDWNGPFYIEVENSAYPFLNNHEAEEAARQIIEPLSQSIRKAHDEHARIIKTFCLMEIDDVSEKLDDVTSDMKSYYGAKAANLCHDDCAEDAIASVESWITANVSNNLWIGRIAAVVSFLGREKAMELCGLEMNTRIEPETGTCATMPDGETTIVIDSVVSQVRGGWVVKDQNDEEHRVSYNGSSWEVEIGA